MDRIVYISNWPMASGLCQSTVIPSIDVLRKVFTDSEFILITPEEKPVKESHPGFEHVGVKMQGAKGPWNRIMNFIRFVLEVGEAVKAHQRGKVLVWARSSPAGLYGCIAWKLWRAPFVVESFEPHADYMCEGGTWAAGGLKARIQRWSERCQKTHARALVTVSAHYRQRLIKEGFPSERIANLPCGTNFSTFKYNLQDRERLRAEVFGTDHHSLQIAIYVGKFGDIYYDDPFFDWVQTQVKGNPKFRLMVLSPMAQHAEHQLQSRGIARSIYHVTAVSHEAVPSYLSAADVGLCFVHQAPSRLYCSPIKVGEYLACGLPVLISKGIGEDSDWIAKHGTGAVIDLEVGQPQLAALDFGVERSVIRALARPWRSIEHNSDQYLALAKTLGMR